MHFSRDGEEEPSDIVRLAMARIKTLVRAARNVARV